MYVFLSKNFLKCGQFAILTQFLSSTAYFSIKYTYLYNKLGLSEELSIILIET